MCGRWRITYELLYGKLPGLGTIPEDFNAPRIESRSRSPFRSQRARKEGGGGCSARRATKGLTRLVHGGQRRSIACDDRQCTDPPPYYTIVMEDGTERSTVRSKLLPVEGDDEGQEGLSGEGGGAAVAKAMRARHAVLGRAFCERLLERDETRRPSAAEAMSDPWITEALAAITRKPGASGEDDADDPTEDVALETSEVEQRGGGAGAVRLSAEQRAPCAYYALRARDPDGCTDAQGPSFGLPRSGCGRIGESQDELRGVLSAHPVQPALTSISFAALTLVRRGYRVALVPRCHAFQRRRPGGGTRTARMPGAQRQKSTWQWRNERRSAGSR